MFTHADKGNLTVCMDTKEYIMKMENLLNDQNTYVKIKINPNIELQKRSS